MSSVRMCDTCGNIFSENEQGWTTLTGTMQLRDENGRRYQKEVEKDKCANCTAVEIGPTVPRIQLPSATPSQRVREYLEGTEVTD